MDSTGLRSDLPDVPATDAFQDVRYKSGALGKRWAAGWVNGYGDVQLYELRYPDTRDSSRLSIFGRYLTPDGIHQMRETMEKLNQQP
jgi:hypothetical protein